MKTTITLFFALLLLAGCSSEDGTQTIPATSLIEPQENKVLLLKVDFETQAFEGGKTLTLMDAPNFTIAHEYQSPGDFGGIALRYAETDELLFSGTIHWAGLGTMDYPTNLDAADSFETNTNMSPLPDASLFQNVQYDTNAYYPDPVPYEAIWDAIGGLELVSEFRASNPNGVVNVFLYTPSVGIGNPADWDYFILLKN